MTEDAPSPLPPSIEVDTTIRVGCRVNFNGRMARVVAVHQDDAVEIEYLDHTGSGPKRWLQQARLMTFVGPPTPPEGMVTK